ncbi:MAG: DNA repair protein RecN [Bacteroidia bacterium]
MLQSLRIHNLALLRAVEINWEAHLNLITGETGAGKSLLIEALGALLGFRVELPPLREKAIVEAEFAPVPPAVQALLEEPAEVLWLRCELLPTGRRRHFLNDSPISAPTLRQIAYYLVEIHSQHETQQLFQSGFQRELLDSYAELEPELRAYQAAYREWKELQAQLEALESRQQAVAQRLDWLTAQVDELEKARLSPEEYATLEGLIRRLEYQEQAAQTLLHWQRYLSESPQAPLRLLKEAVRALQRFPLDEIAAITAQLENARSSLQEAAAHMESLLSHLTLDPYAVEKARQRYDLYNTLLLKYQAVEVSQLIGLYEKYRAERDALQREVESLEPLRNQYEVLTGRLLEQAYRLELARLGAAQALADRVQAYLAELGLDYAAFHIAVERLKDPQSSYRWAEEGVQLTPYGFSAVQFLLRTQPDFPFQPLSGVASGGELSRIMLALKAALAERIRLPTLVLDEIDTGLSGEGARRMGEFLAKLADRVQIILITHLPAIAAQRGAHFRVWREGDLTQIVRLSESQRVEEIARLLGGESAGEAAQAAARALLQAAS